MDVDVFRKYRGQWILWRTLGHYSDNGAWVAPVSFMEAQTLPKDMIDAFFTLDELLGKMQRQHAKKKLEETPNAKL